MNFDFQLISGEFWGNSIDSYILAIGVFLVWVVALLLIKFVINLKLKPPSTVEKVRDLVFMLLSTISVPLIVVVAAYIAAKPLTVADWFNQAFFIALVCTIIYQLNISFQIIANYFIHTKLEDEPATQNAFQSLTTIGKFFVAILGFLFILQNVGINVTSLIAGLGIGGIAIALAAQNILGDLFSSFALLFDKPFVPGDFIIVGKDMGVVEKVGIKTTRIKSLQGEEIAIPNTELTAARIQNFKRMEERRVAFSLGVTYDTPKSKVEKIPAMIQKIIEEEENVRFDRAHFKRFGDSSLDFEIIYYVLNNEYLVFMNAQQSINLKIMEAFEKHSIEFAFPTRTVHVVKN